MSLVLAIRAFFAILFGLALPEPLIRRALQQAAKPEPEVLPPPPPPPPPQQAQPPPPPPKVETPKGPAPEAIAVRAISVFQAEGRLLDFLSEDIDGFNDADVGAAVREIHRGCRRALKDHFKLV